MGHFLSNSLRQSTSRETAEGRRSKTFSYWLFLVFAGSQPCRRYLWGAKIISAVFCQLLHPHRLILQNADALQLHRPVAERQHWRHLWKPFYLKKISLGLVCLTSNTSHRSVMCQQHTARFDNARRLLPEVLSQTMWTQKTESAGVARLLAVMVDLL